MFGYCSRSEGFKVSNTLIMFTTRKFQPRSKQDFTRMQCILPEVPTRMGLQ